MMSMPTWEGVELVLDAKAILGEGPFWHQADGLLYWVNITHGEIHAFDPQTHFDRTWTIGQPVGAAAPRIKGGLVLAVRDGFGLISSDGEFELIVEVEADRPGRMNDGKCDPAGRFFAGTLGKDEEPGAGSFYRLNPDFTVTLIQAGTTISNGLDWSVDGKLLYYIDSPEHGVDVFDFDPATGAATNRRRFIDIPAELGLPDGMTVDSEGFLWVAMWGGWSVRRFSPDGVPAGVVKVPVPQPSSCAFGGDDLSNLYITSARQRLSDGELRASPQSGGLFRVQPGVEGLPVKGFAG